MFPSYAFSALRPQAQAGILSPSTISLRGVQVDQTHDLTLGERLLESRSCLRRLRAARSEAHKPVPLAEAQQLHHPRKMQAVHQQFLMKMVRHHHNARPHLLLHLMSPRRLSSCAPRQPHQMHCFMGPACISARPQGSIPMCLKMEPLHERAVNRLVVNLPQRLSSRLHMLIETL